MPEYRKTKSPSGRSFYIITDRGKLVTISRQPPSFIEIFPSLECNVSCASCDRGQDRSSLQDFTDITSLVDNLRQDPEFCLSHFRISGKEPLLYPKINELIGFLSRTFPGVGVHLFTNGLALKTLTQKSLSLVTLNVSIYRDTLDVLQKDPVVKKILKSKGVPLEVNVRHHEDLSATGKKRNRFDPLLNCFSAVLLCGTGKVYPCCRAHRFEQMFKKKYHGRSGAKGLYQRLKDIIKKTDLCLHCPRCYSDRVLIKR
jgi:MoaA/NifB/PqqE/SkfB family radical SAM enzyme